MIAAALPLWETLGVEAALPDARFVDDYEVILLDQGKTFMFENDRFGPDEDYFRTYTGLGGTQLTAQTLHRVMDELVCYMAELGRNPDRYDSFPTVSEALREIPAAKYLPSADFPLINELVAQHEVGSISKRHADCLRALSTTHRLGIVSNIWGRKNPFVRNLVEAGILDCFEHIVWSSDRGCLKPSPKLFHHALSLFGVPASMTLFVGDHPFRDVVAAKACGCSTVWIQNEKEQFPPDCLAPDLTVAHLEDLLFTRHD